MSRFLVLGLGLLFFVTGLLVLARLGDHFSAYAFPRDSLSVEKPLERSLTLGRSAILDLQGTGFNTETSVSLFMDITNGEAVIGSFPLAGIFNASLQFADVLYLGTSNDGLKVLNISTPRQPQLLKEYLPGRSIIDICRSGNLLFLSCGKAGISIMQILDSGLLTHVVDIPVALAATQCQVVDGFLLVAAASQGLLVYDIRQLDRIELVHSLDSASFVSRISLADRFLYLATLEKEIFIYRIDDPQYPVFAGKLELTEPPRDILVLQNLLYVATRGGVSSYGLAEPDQPELLNHWSDCGSAERLFAGREQVYISDSFSGLRIADSRGGSSSGYINLSVNPRIVVETPDCLYVAGSDMGLLIVDRKAIMPRQFINEINTSGSAHDIHLKNGWIYIADARGGALYKNLNDNNSVLTRLSSRWSESFAEQRNLLFVAQGKNGVEVFDVSSPEAPEAMAAWSDLQAMRVAVVDNYMVIANGISGLKLVDITDLSKPIVMDALEDTHVLDVAADGRRIYATGKDNGLLIYEINAAAELQLLSHLTLPFPMNRFALPIAVQVQDAIAYVANGRSGLLIVDVKNPRKPKILSTLDLPGISKGLHVVNEMVFVSSQYGGISAVDVKVPAAPRTLGAMPMRGVSRGVQVADDLIYVTHNEKGVSAVPVPVIAESLELESAQRMTVTLPSPKYPGRYSLQVSNRNGTVIYDGIVRYQPN